MLVNRHGLRPPLPAEVVGEQVAGDCQDPGSLVAKLGIEPMPEAHDALEGGACQVLGCRRVHGIREEGVDGSHLLGEDPPERIVGRGRGSAQHPDTVTGAPKAKPRWPVSRPALAAVAAVRGAAVAKPAEAGHDCAEGDEDPHEPRARARTGRDRGADRLQRVVGLCGGRVGLVALGPLGAVPLAGPGAPLGRRGVRPLSGAGPGGQAKDGLADRPGVLERGRGSPGHASAHATALAAAVTAAAAAARTLIAAGGGDRFAILVDPRGSRRRLAVRRRGLSRQRADEDAGGQRQDNEGEAKCRPRTHLVSTYAPALSRLTAFGSRSDECVQSSGPLRTPMASPGVAQTPGRTPAAQTRDGRLAPALAFLATAGLLVAYALRGGSYDIVVRQEMGLGIWWVLGLGFAVGVLPRAPLPRVRLLGVATLVLVGIWVAIGLGWTESAERTTAELGRIVAYAGLLLLPLALLDRGTWRAAVGGIVAAALLIAVLGVASRLFPGDFPKDLIAASFKGQRLNYPFHYWNAVGSWAAMAIALALAWSAHARALVGRMLALTAIPTAGVAVYLTYSRSSVAGGALGGLVVLVASRNRGVVLGHALAAGAGAAAGVLAVRDAPQTAHAPGAAGHGRAIV